MTKSQLIEKVAEHFGDFKKRDVELAVNTIFDSMKDALVNERRVEIRDWELFALSTEKLVKVAIQEWRECQH